MLCIRFCTLPPQFSTQTYAGRGRLNAQNKNNGCEHTLETLWGYTDPGSSEYEQRRFPALCVRPYSAGKTVGSISVLCPKWKWEMGSLLNLGQGLHESPIEVFLKTEWRDLLQLLVSHYFEMTDKSRGKLGMWLWIFIFNEELVCHLAPVDLAKTLSYTVWDQGRSFEVYLYLCFLIFIANFTQKLLPGPYKCKTRIQYLSPEL